MREFRQEFRVIEKSNELREPAGGGRPVTMEETELRQLVESITDYAIFLLAPDGTVRTWNAGAARLMGYRADEVVGRPFTLFLPGADAEYRARDELAVAAREGRFETEGWRVRKDGSRFFANVVIRPVRDRAGEVVGFSKVTRDVTRTHEALNQLRQSEERFRLIVDEVRDFAIFMLDPRGNVASWNKGAQRIKGYTAAEIIGRHFSAFYPASDIAAGKCERELECAMRDGRVEDEGWRVRKDGSLFWANVVITRLHDTEGRLFGFAKCTQDLTTRKQAEDARLQLVEEQVARRESERRERERLALIEQLEQTNTRLEEAVRARDDFLTIASHELKTPLYTLALQLTSGLVTAQKDAIPERLRRRLENGQQEIGRLTKLINNLLDVSRITANRLLMAPEELDLVAVAKDVLEREHAEIASTGTKVTLDAPAALTGFWDRTRLDQILTNLLTNALKYGNRKPISIGLEALEDAVRIRVRDEGLGIDPADHERIFQRFERAVSGQSYSGFGLGLWIVRQIVDAMGGTIGVESKKGAGSTFTVELPRRQVAKAS